MLYVLRERGNAELIVFVEKLRELPMVSLIVRNLSCFSHNAGTLFLQLGLADKEFTVQRSFHLGTCRDRRELIKEFSSVLEENAVLRCLFAHIAPNPVQLQ